MKGVDIKIMIFLSFAIDVMLSFDRIHTCEANIRAAVRRSNVQRAQHRAVGIRVIPNGYDDSASILTRIYGEDG